MVLIPFAVLLGLAVTAQDRAPTIESPPAAEAKPRGLVLRAEAATPGFVLIAPLRSTTTFLLDESGEVVHTWKSAFPPGNSVVLLADGSILRACRVENSTFQAGGMGGRLQRIAWDGTVTWDFALSSPERIQHHDARMLPNGNVLTLVWDDMWKTDAIAAGRDPAHVPEAGLRPDSILELRPIPPSAAEIVWEWRARDHLIQDFDATKSGYGDVAAHPERIDFNGDHRRTAPLTEAQKQQRAETERRMRSTGYAGGGDPDARPADTSARPGGPGRDSDWLHANSVDWLPDQDLIVLSVRHMDEIWVIDHSTTTEEARGSTGGRWKRGGDLLARWGNPRMHGAGTSADRRLFRQHDASWIGAEEGGLALLVFNNGEGRLDGEYSSVDEVLLPFDRERGFGATAKVAPRWSYAAPDKPKFYSSFLSGAQRLSNGHTLVCSGVQGRVFEVQRDGTIVWEFRNPHGGDVALGPPRGREPDDAGLKGSGRPAADGTPNALPRGERGGARGGRTGLDDNALFRATHIAPDHPGVARLRDAPK